MKKFISMVLAVFAAFIFSLSADANVGGISTDIHNPTGLGPTGFNSFANNEISAKLTGNSHYYGFRAKKTTYKFRYETALCVTKMVLYDSIDLNDPIASGSSQICNETLTYTKFVPGHFYIVAIINGNQTGYYYLSWNYDASKPFNAIDLSPIDVVEADNDSRAADWYSDYWSANQSIKIKVNGYTSSSDFDIYVYDSDRTTLLASSTANNYPKIVNFITTGRKTFIKIVRKSGGGNYRLEVLPGKPSAPRNLSATQGTRSDGVRLIWNVPIYGPAHHYQVYRANTPTGTKALIKGSIKTTAYLDKTAKSGQYYYYWVKACSSANECSPFGNRAKGWFQESSQTVQFKSLELQDTTLVESSETSNVGGGGDSTLEYLNIGDTNEDQQRLSIISFDTSELPDNVVIKSAKIILKCIDTNCTDFLITEFGGLVIDISKTPFSGNPAPQITDFEAPANLYDAGSYSVVSMEIQVELIPGAYQFINKTGYTQFKIRFALDDNDNMEDDRIYLWAGDVVSAAPTLIITYLVP